jgi:LacI family transcriptional regulator
MRRRRSSAPSGRSFKVALMIETSNAYARGLMHGIVSYMREHRRWSIYLVEHSRGARPPEWLSDWAGQGVIARIENPAIARQMKRLRVPIVDVSAARLIPSLPWVETDDAAIARLAVEHFLERGFRHFAFCSDERFNWSRWRREHFEEILQHAGHTCHVHAPRVARNAAEERGLAALEQWVVDLPKPVGILACYDFRGQQLLDACRRNGISVPDEVAVLGVDNDELLCDLTDPPMSSVILNTHRTGYQAAALLDRMMSGESVKAEAHLIEPLGIATRQSTDVLAIEDPDVVAAVRFIREHACEGISMKDVLRALPQSRRVLETRFRRSLGRTPHEEIMRVRLNRARLLLAESDLTLERIAALAGFSHVEYFSTVFRKEAGLPPSRYRTLNRRRPAAPPAGDVSPQRTQRMD